MKYFKCQICDYLTHERGDMEKHLLDNPGHSYSWPYDEEGNIIR